MILSVDQALTKTGASVFEDDGTLVDVTTWTIPAKANSLPERLDRFLLNMEDMCRKYPIDKVAFEGVQQQYNVETFKKLSILQGILEYWCEFAELKYVILSPSHWRRIITTSSGIKFGKKRPEQKQKAQEFVKQKFGREVDSDEADSVCLGYASIINNEFEDKYAESAF